jgi:hypothetical protein
LRWDEDVDASGARPSADEAVAFRQNHLMDRRTADAKCRCIGWPDLTEHVPIDVDEGQILALRFMKRCGAVPDF